MERPNTVAGLLAKRDELRWDLAEAEKVAKALRINIDHIDATLRLFDGNGTPPRLRGAAVAHRAKRGELQRFVLRQLREAEGPLTS
ncbi:hypothetical protein [Parvularcula dongshanensis]|uniref:Uncharacterized protein n=1 Tax=Parvularcula dongshanensis TaxID=1173995 RepID=A0A840I607_9PROT|nr:hypothetical protein [Parvularcula dongshanensis]MBB4660257.1 hypothetical protein [Parvularcula dongshanensis]